MQPGGMHENVPPVIPPIFLPIVLPVISLIVPPVIPPVVPASQRPAHHPSVPAQEMGAQQETRLICKRLHPTRPHRTSFATTPRVCPANCTADTLKDGWFGYGCLPVSPRCTAGTAGSRRGNTPSRWGAQRRRRLSARHGTGNNAGKFRVNTRTRTRLRAPVQRIGVRHC